MCYNIHEAHLIHITVGYTIGVYTLKPIAAVISTSNCLVLTVYIHCSYTRVLQKKDLDGKFQYYTKNSKENGYICQVKTKW